MGPASSAPNVDRDLAGVGDHLLGSLGFWYLFGLRAACVRLLGGLGEPSSRCGRVRSSQGRFYPPKKALRAPKLEVASLRAPTGAC